MAVTYSIIGFKGYVIIDKVLYRKAYVAKSKSCKFQYRAMRMIKRSIKDNVEGYYLVKNNKRKFYSLK